jgi:hypothetical protein
MILSQVQIVSTLAEIVVIKVQMVLRKMQMLQGFKEMGLRTAQKRSGLV